MPLAPTDTYRLEKSIWTDSDFDAMGWHDVRIHALAFDLERNEFMLDLDYIFAWVDPLPPSPGFSFWLAPSTLVFHDTWEINIECEISRGFQLQGLQRNEGRRPSVAGKPEEWRWVLDGNEGQISFWAAGYSQFTRRVPAHHAKSQWYTLVERGGVSFERPDCAR
jgi:hypothetical protein